MTKPDVNMELLSLLKEIDRYIVTINPNIENSLEARIKLAIANAEAVQ